MAGYTVSEGASYGWSHFFSRVLPQPGANSCIHNEDITEPAFDMSAPPETRAASLRALGWPEGCLPDKPALLAHMLHSVEYEYAAHCFHDHVPGKRCSVCSFDPRKEDPGEPLRDDARLRLRRRPRRRRRLRG